MPFSRPRVDIRAPPSDFDEQVDWFEKWSYGLVLLEEYPLSDLRAAIQAVEAGVRAHCETARRSRAPSAGAADEVARAKQVVASDHEWFQVSLEQLWWFFRIVEAEDHGGHRQALGQYGRVFAEALRRHRKEERWLDGHRDPRRESGRVRRSGKP